MAEDRGILAGHKRVGKRFIPPMAQLSLSHTSWLVSMLPELVWIGLLHHECCDKRATELALSVARIAADTSPPDKHVWYALASNYSCLPADSVSEVAERIKELEGFGELREVLAPLARLYPGFPLCFALGDVGSAEASRVADLLQFKPVLAGLYDRRGRAAMMIQATAMYIAFVTGVMVANRNSSLAELPAIQDYPETEESKMVGASIRAAMNSMTGLELVEKERTWPRDFWNRGLQLEPCHFGGGAEADV